MHSHLDEYCQLNIYHQHCLVELENLFMVFLVVSCQSDFTDLCTKGVQTTEDLELEEFSFASQTVLCYENKWDEPDYFSSVSSARLLRAKLQEICFHKCGQEFHTYFPPLAGPVSSGEVC